jgi:hypothetical protein
MSGTRPVWSFDSARSNQLSFVAEETSQDRLSPSPSTDSGCRRRMVTQKETGVLIMKQATDLAHANIERLAYALWQQRGRPLGSPQEDWFRAERELLLVDRRSYMDSPAALPFSSISMGPEEL